MDPSFFFVTAHVLQQQHMLYSEIAQDRQECDYEEYKAWFEEKRRELIDTAQDEASVLKGEVYEYPERTFVKLQLILSTLNNYEVLPEEFSDQLEQEKIILLWRKLINLSEKSKSLMTSEQMEQCKECLSAVAMENFIQVTASRLEAYQTCQELDAQLDVLRSKNSEVTKYKYRSILLVILVGAVSFLISSSQFELIANGLFLLWVLGGLGIGNLLNMYWENQKPKNLKEIVMDYDKSADKAHIEDDQFWQAVKKNLMASHQWIS